MEEKTKLLIFGALVRAKILRGVEMVEKAVGTTLGSKGRNVALEKNWGAPIILHDGVSVARDIILKDPYENLAAQLVITAAKKTNDEAGDGTTTATILTHAIVREAMQLVAAGTNPMVIRKGIEKGVAAVVTELQAMAKPVKTQEELVSVATISAADEEIGKLIATAVDKVGRDGVVTVQASQSSTIEVQYKEGIEFDRGLLSHYFVTDPETHEAIIAMEKQGEFPYIVTVNEKLTTPKVVTIMKFIVGQDKSAKVLFIADDIEPEAVQMMVFNRVRQNVPIFVVRAPDYGEHRTNLLLDIATVCGGQVLGGPAGIPLDQASYSDVGRAERVVIGKESTIIIGGQGSKDKIAERIRSLDKLYAETKTDGMRDKIAGRKAKLSGGVAVIAVGAHSEAEMREKKERVIDAKNATQAAIQEGILPGGGVALLHARSAAKRLNLGKPQVGADIIYSALTYPIRRLIDNAGSQDPGYVIGKITEDESRTIGYNVDSEEFENFIETGIIDPTKVVRCALVNAASVATMLITTEAMIVFDREKPAKANADDEGIGQIL